MVDRRWGSAEKGAVDRRAAPPRPTDYGAEEFGILLRLHPLRTRCRDDLCAVLLDRLVGFRRLLSGRHQAAV